MQQAVSCQQGVSCILSCQTTCDPGEFVRPQNSVCTRARHAALCGLSDPCHPLCYCYQPLKLHEAVPLMSSGLTPAEATKMASKARHVGAHPHQHDTDSAAAF